MPDKTNYMQKQTDHPLIWSGQQPVILDWRFSDLTICRKLVVWKTDFNILPALVVAQSLECFSSYI